MTLAPIQKTPLRRICSSILSALSMLLAVNVSQAESPMIDCDLKTLASFCDKLKAKEQTQLRSKIPHKFSNGETMPSIDSMSGDTLSYTDSGQLNLPWGKMQRLQKLFVKTKKYAEDAILQGRSYDALSDEEKNLVERVRTVKLSEFRTEQERETCRSNYHYGYDPRIHTLVMCPEMADYPSSGIVWAMGAFIGRGLGNCTTGAVKTIDPKTKKVTETIPHDKHPFKTHLRSCLVKGGYPEGSEGLDFNRPELQAIVQTQITHSHKAKHAELPNRADSLASALKDEKNIAWAKKLVEGHPECLPHLTNARVDAGVQDWFGSEVAARYLEDHPLNAQTPEDNLQPVASMVDFICRVPKADELTSKFHVPIEMRLESAIFANDRLRSAMNCNPKVPAKQVCTIGEKGTSSKPAGSKRPGSPNQTVQ